MLNDRTGQKIPSTLFRAREGGEWKNLDTASLFDGKRVVVFSLPGAFTPTCSSQHLPRYNALAPAFAAEGIDGIYCVSVNDGFVMEAWAADQHSESVTLLPDGNGEFTEGMDMLVDKSDLGFGKRSWRYAMVVNDGVIEKMFIEPNKPGDPFEVSDADTVLAYLNPQSPSLQKVSLFTKPGCPFCAKAKALLTEHGYDFEEISLSDGVSMMTVQNLTGQNSVPQVFINGSHIGGSDDLEAHLS